MPKRTPPRPWIVPAAAALAVAAGWCAPAVAQQRTRIPDAELSMSGAGMRGAFKEVVAGGANAATVRVRVGPKEVALGTIVSADGYVLTKASELTPPAPATRPAGAPAVAVDPVVVLRDGTARPATVVGVAEDHDLALLKIDPKGLKQALTPVRWANPATAAVVGQWVVTPGMADAPAAVGVLSVGRRRIPAKTGMLGVALQDAGNRSGAMVTQVLTGSPAERAGLKAADVIARVNDTAVDGRRTLIDAVRGLEPGTDVRLVVRRGEQEMDVRATLGSGIGPAARSEMMNAMGGAPSRRNANFPAVLQHDTVLLPSLCGGPLVGLDGSAVGVNIARAGRTESYAVPADVVVKLLPDLKSGKLAPKSQTKPTTKPAERKNED